MVTVLPKKLRRFAFFAHGFESLFADVHKIHPNIPKRFHQRFNKAFGKLEILVLRIGLLEAVFEFFQNSSSFIVPFAPINNIAVSISDFDSPTAFLVKDNRKTVFELKNSP